MLYQKTKTILYVKEQLGHRRIETTLVYTHLIRFSDEEYVSAVAKTVEGARKLVEAGFEYVTEIEGIRLFRKRKWQEIVFHILRLSSSFRTRHYSIGVNPWSIMSFLIF